MSNDDMEHFDAIFLRATAAGVLVNIEGEDIWLPRLKCEFEPPPDCMEEGDDCEVGVPQWLAKKEGLL